MKKQSKSQQIKYIKERAKKYNLVEMTKKDIWSECFFYQREFIMDTGHSDIKNGRNKTYSQLCRMRSEKFYVKWDGYYWVILYRI